jgi:hypothetical protein
MQRPLFRGGPARAGGAQAELCCGRCSGLKATNLTEFCYALRPMLRNDSGTFFRSSAGGLGRYGSSVGAQHEPLCSARYSLQDTSPFCRAYAVISFFGQGGGLGLFRRLGRSGRRLVWLGRLCSPRRSRIGTSDQRPAGQGPRAGQVLAAGYWDGRGLSGCCLCTSGTGNHGCGIGRTWWLGCSMGGCTCFRRGVTLDSNGCGQGERVRRIADCGIPNPLRPLLPLPPLPSQLL